MAEIKGGYWGKVAWVDMANGQVTIQNFDDDFARKYLGGVGLATKLVSDKVTKNTNPLGPGNVLVFATGPFQATSIPSSGRSAIAAKSPLTGYWGESSGGGHLGPELKRCGFDAIAVTGRARKPSYLFVSENSIEVREAEKYWGMDNVEVVDALRADLDIKGMAVTTIGQAGENLVRYASIGNEKHGYHGRCGLGAVMGSKNLKAVVAKGSLAPPLADPKGLKVYFKELRKAMMANEFCDVNREHGQAVAVAAREENGLLPMKNWDQDSWDKAPDISAPVFTEQLDAKPWPCPNCFMGCHRKISSPNHPGAETGGPEYETLGMIGSNLLIDNLADLVDANEILNRYGIDTIEIGGVLGWAFECYEKGIITSQDTDGVELTWGNGKALIAMCEQVGKREGFGNLLAEGIRACVDAYPQTKEYAIESMGQVFGAHDPRAFYGQVITSIASTRGACHLHGFAEANELGVVMPELGIDEASMPDDNTNKGVLGAVFQDVAQVWNSLTMCLLYFFAGMDFPAEAKILNYITGWDVTPKELAKMGERIVCMQQVFNLEMGLVPEVENVMPERMTKPHAEGGAAGQVPDWQGIVSEYWSAKGWDAKGIPTSEKLTELGLRG
jgi:aldehyde:ferredoxin oxidoreductase